VGVIDSVFLPAGGTLTATGIVGWMARLLVISERRLKVIDTRYAAEIKRINRDHDAELKELRAARTNDIADLRRSIAALHARVDDLGSRLDQERQLRFAAEDRAARAERGGEQRANR
jgi:outer membrane murein-binding lipoprotein Lpp